MEFSGEYRIPAPREKVWAALNDPEALKAAIPGCQEMTKVGDNELAAKVRAKVGPVSATFAGDVKLEELNPPESYRLVGSGKGGAAGFAKGSAAVHLAEDGADTTILTYNAQADVGGKLAQLGSRLIQGTAKKYADDFFSNLSAQVSGPQAKPETIAAEAPAAIERPAAATAPVPSAAERAPVQPGGKMPGEAGLQRFYIGFAVAAVVLFLLYLFFR